MTSKVRRLYDLEIDEISLVDRPANQHGLVAIAKRAEAPKMSLVDEDGYEVDPEELDIGEFAFDTETGQRFVMATPEQAAELGYEVDDDASELDEYADEDEYASVGKLSAGDVSATLTGAGARARGAAARSGRAAGRKVKEANRGVRSGLKGENPLSWKSGTQRNSAAIGRHVGRNKVRYGAGAAVTAGAGGYEATRKSLGQEVLESLSKALDDGDRDEVISKLGDIVADARSDANAAWQVAKSLAEQRELDDYAALADTYELPVDPRQFGGILMQVSKALSPEDLSVLDRVLSASGVGFEALGYDGPGESDVISQVYAMATEAVGKSDGGISVEQATTALFEANPDAYDAYCAETR